jgi:uncharacterized membrane protein
VTAGRACSSRSEGAAWAALHSDLEGAGHLAVSITCLHLHRARQLRHHSKSVAEQVAARFAEAGRETGRASAAGGTASKVAATASKPCASSYCSRPSG